VSIHLLERRVNRRKRKRTRGEPAAGGTFKTDHLPGRGGGGEKAGGGQVIGPNVQIGEAYKRTPGKRRKTGLNKDSSKNQNAEKRQSFKGTQGPCRGKKVGGRKNSMGDISGVTTGRTSLQPTKKGPWGGKPSGRPHFTDPRRIEGRLGTRTNPKRERKQKTKKKNLGEV